jgi:DNA-binding NarL/FixJ family response regulator
MEDRHSTHKSTSLSGSSQPWVSRVYIVDDHRFFTYALMALVNSQADLSVCGVAHDETVAMDELLQLSPDVVVVDVRLNARGGFALAAAVRRFSKNIPILFVSSLQKPSFGADVKWLEPCSFVEKTQDPADIIAGIRQMLAAFRLRHSLHPTSNS